MSASNFNEYAILELCSYIDNMPNISMSQEQDVNFENVVEVYNNVVVYQKQSSWSALIELTRLAMLH